MEVSLSGINAGDVGSLLATVTFAALVIERAVEVYISYMVPPYKSTEILTAERTLARARNDLTQAERQALAGDRPNQATLDELRREVDAKRQVLETTEQGELNENPVKKKTDLARVATIVLGFLTAAVGIRVLGQFLPMENGTVTGPLANSKTQLMWFRTLDILLTTFVLAGGADGVHQIIKRLTKSGGSQ